MSVQYEEGLLELEGFSHIFLFFLFHRANPSQMLMKLYWGNQAHGIFATRGPHRPNSIGFSLVRLIKREGPVLHLDDVDILDGTPLIDIKPFVERFDIRTGTRQGWQPRSTRRRYISGVYEIM
ncbi:tRNA (N6-threonylcarbamoyladenosine(37)-N6)-methyltransferase TrmO [candidate division KSB3 bacterium]|uniref:tRNA (N6-threonylcarbamoyladenosine(37)-N6)-methyltransferase TrmO n=1 Tax=candidate division KSB3 bacterium TaxID=2044937 RepID=A0A2G6KCJ9_9BACT|nr:MAG: tRNA (N6-threonylcarbamoyladenosine(37)-N6)-methyltransferase TrmO [candidate division KSB3 bacterium]